MRNWKRLISPVATGVVIVLFAMYAINNRNSLSGLLEISWATLVFVGIGRMLIFFSNGMFVKWTAEAFTRRLSVGEGIYVGFLSALGNFFGPLLGGTGIRAVYLRRIHNLPYTKFTSTLMIYYVIFFMVNFTLALGGLMTLNLQETPYFLIGLLTVGILALLSSVFIRLPRRMQSDNPEGSTIVRKVVRYIVDIESGWRLMLTMPPLLVRLVALAALSVVAQLLIAYVAFESIGADISWGSLAVYVSIVAVSLLVAFTPGAVGIREAMLLLVSETLGVTDSEIIQVAVIDRGVTFVLLLLLFLLTRHSRLRRKLTSHDLQV